MDGWCPEAVKTQVRSSDLLRMEGRVRFGRVLDLAVVVMVFLVPQTGIKCRARASAESFGVVTSHLSHRLCSSGIHRSVPSYWFKTLYCVVLIITPPILRPEVCKPSPSDNPSALAHLASSTTRVYQNAQPRRPDPWGCGVLRVSQASPACHGPIQHAYQC